MQRKKSWEKKLSLFFSFFSSSVPLLFLYFFHDEKLHIKWSFWIFHFSSPRSFSFLFYSFHFTSLAWKGELVAKLLLKSYLYDFFLSRFSFIWWSHFFNYITTLLCIFPKTSTIWKVACLLIQNAYTLEE